MAEPTNLSRSQDEYGSSVSPYAALSDYLMQQPVYDRSPREAPATPTMRQVQVDGPTTENLLSNQYSKIMADQKVADAASSDATKTEIENLQKLLREELSTSEDAASSQRSDMTTALEGRINELRAGVDTSTEALRQQGIDERSAITTEQQRISDMVQSNIDKTTADLSAQEARVREAQAAAIGSLEDRQGSLIGDINTRIGELGASLNDTTAQINSELDSRDAALTGTQKSAAEAAQQQIDALKGDLVTIQGDISAENSAQLQALRGERETLLGNIEANVQSLKDNIAGLPIDSLQAQIETLRGETESLKGTASDERKNLFAQMEALRDGALSNDQVNSSISKAIEDGTLSPDQINTAIEALKLDVEGKIGGMASAQSLSQLQEAVAGATAANTSLGLDIETMRKALDGTATKEELALIQESLSKSTGSFDARFAELQGKMLDPESIAKQREDAIAAAMNPLAAQRQEAISGAINPIQEQIDALRGSIPAQQNIDVDALRKSIMDEINAQQPPVATTPPPVATTPPPVATTPPPAQDQIPDYVGPSDSEAGGFNNASFGGTPYSEFYTGASIPPISALNQTSLESARRWMEDNGLSGIRARM